jgi:uncharacterized protein YdeI (YjbR/CyaY-like superfamily)
MPEAPPLEDLIVADAAAWRSWLEVHHADSDGVWLVMAKKGVTEPTGLKVEDALQDALCYGWIDGQRRTRDDTTFRQRFTSRRPRSPWSKRNVGFVEALTAAGLMRPSGLAEVQRAKDDGRWAAAYGGTDQEVPDDLAAALAAEPRAAAMFEILTSQNRFAVVYRVNEAKRPDTRARRIAQYTSMLARGETIYPQKRSLERGR